MCKDFGDLHHDGSVVMTCVGERRTAAYNYCLADKAPERRSQLFVGGKNVNRARSPDSFVAVVRIETGI
jgi:hypothetical protein